MKNCKEKSIKYSFSSWTQSLELIDGSMNRLKMNTVKPLLVNTSKFEQTWDPPKRFLLETHLSNMNTSLFWTWTPFFQSLLHENLSNVNMLFWPCSLFSFSFSIFDGFKCIFHWFECNTYKVINGNKTWSNFTWKSTTNFR